MRSKWIAERATSCRHSPTWACLSSGSTTVSRSRNSVASASTRSPSAATTGRAASTEDGNDSSTTRARSASATPLRCAVWRWCSSTRGPTRSKRTSAQLAELAAVEGDLEHARPAGQSRAVEQLLVPAARSRAGAGPPPRPSRRGGTRRSACSPAVRAANVGGGSGGAAAASDAAAQAEPGAAGRRGRSAARSLPAHRLARVLLVEPLLERREVVEDRGGVHLRARRSAPPAPPARAGSAHRQHRRAAARPPPCCRRSSSGCSGPGLARRLGTARGGTGTAGCGPGSSACRARWPGTWYLAPGSKSASLRAHRRRDALVLLRAAPTTPRCSWRA